MKLLPCPFCGAKEVEQVESHVWCRKCEARGPVARCYEDDPTETWNTRVRVPAPAGDCPNCGGKVVCENCRGAGSVRMSENGKIYE